MKPRITSALACKLPPMREGPMVLTASRIVRTILFSAMILSLAACSFAESKDAAEQSANTLYHTVATGDMDAVMDLYSD